MGRHEKKEKQEKNDVCFSHHLSADPRGAKRKNHIQSSLEKQKYIFHRTI